MRVVVNGLESTVNIDNHLVDDILIPQLEALAGAGEGRRRFLFLAAPPGVGKSTLAAVLEQRGAHLGIDTIGIDGFHYPSSYLATHNRAGEGGAVSLKSIKGAPETFDVARLEQYLARSATDETVWPVYDRTVHDVVAASKPIRAPLVLLEGNWLLLDEPGWRALTDHSVFNIFIEADADMLSRRLIERKIRGGLDRASAVDFFEKSDRPNIERVLNHTDRRKVDLTLRLDADGTIDRG
jgi:pantothenate kinase